MDAYALLALQSYQSRFEAIWPDLRANVWMGRELIASQRLASRSLEGLRLTLPMREQRATEVTLQRAGKGRLYYRVGVRTVERDVAAPAVAHGFEVSRELVGEDGQGMRRDEAGTWLVKAGSRVIIRTRVKCHGMRCHVALESPLAAGFESINPALRGSEPVDSLRPTPWEHQELHDERTDAFAWTLYGGGYVHDQAVRATTAGRFFMPPAHVEEMYHPETFGRSSSDRVLVY